LFNFRLIEKFTRVANRQTFQALANKVFQGGISMGKILILFWIAAKAVVMVSSAFLILPMAFLF